MSRATRSFLMLLAAAFLCYGGPMIVRLGFYHDDWILLSYLRFAPAGYLARMTAMLAASNTFWFRPLDVPLYAALYTLFGLHPLAWQATLLLINAMTAFAAGRILIRYGVQERMAVIGALLVLVWPNKDATMFWPSVVINSLSLSALLAAYLAHLEYVEGGRRRFLALSIALILASLALYDQCIFLFLLWPVTPRLFTDGVPPRARRGFLAAAGAAGAYLLFKLGFVPHVMGVEFNKTFSFSPYHFAWTFYAGVKAAFGPRLIAFCARSFFVAFRMSPVAAAAALLYPWLLLRVKETASRPRRDAAAALIVLGALIYLLGYLPIAVSDYSPTPINHMNRINEVPVLGLILGLLGLGTLKLKPRFLERGACALASALLAVHVGLASYWVESYRRQNVVREQVLANLDRWPADKMLLLMLPERYVAGKVPVFDAHYDITGAIQIWTGDPTRRADTVSPRMDFTPEGVVRSAGAEALPYDTFMLLESARGIFTSVGYRNFTYRPPKS